RVQDLLIAASPRPRRRLLDLQRPGSQSKKALGNFFDIREYATCDECNPHQTPRRPAIVLDRDRDIQAAYVPDTTHLASDIARTLYPPQAAGPTEETTARHTPPESTLVRRTPHMD